MVTATRMLRAVEYNTVCADIKLTWRESPQGKKKIPLHVYAYSFRLFVYCLPENSQEIILIQSAITNQQCRTFTIYVYNTCVCIHV